MNVIKEQDGMAALLKAAEEAEMNRPKLDPFISIPKDCDYKSCSLDEGICESCSG